jgi:hypothetical protein
VKVRAAESIKTTWLVLRLLPCVHHFGLVLGDDGKDVDRWRDRKKSMMRDATTLDSTVDWDCSVMLLH